MTGTLENSDALDCKSFLDRNICVKTWLWLRALVLAYHGVWLLLLRLITAPPAPQFPKQITVCVCTVITDDSPEIKEESSLAINAQVLLPSAERNFSVCPDEAPGLASHRVLVSRALLFPWHSVLSLCCGHSWNRTLPGLIPEWYPEIGLSIVYSSMLTFCTLKSVPNHAPTELITTTIRSSVFPVLSATAAPWK